MSDQDQFAPFKEPLQPAEVRILIQEEITGGNGIEDSNRAINELGSLVSTSETLDNQSISHLLSLLHDNIDCRVKNITGLTLHLGVGK